MTDVTLLTVTDAAKLLGMNRRTVSEMCRRFEIRWIPWRGSRIHKRIPRAEIDRYIQDHLVANPEQLRRAVDGRRSERFVSNLRRH